MKKIKSLLLALVLVGTVMLPVGCGKQANVEGTLDELMDKVYADVAEENKPMMLMNTEVTEENVEYYLGSADIEYEEALASESAVGSIAHSVVLVRTKDGADIEAIKTKIKENVDARKWICVEAEKVTVENKGNLIILIMSSEDTTKTILNSFNNL